MSHIVTLLTHHVTWNIQVVVENTETWQFQLNPIPGYVSNSHWDWMNIKCTDFLIEHYLML